MIHLTIEISGEAWTIRAASPTPAEWWGGAVSTTGIGAAGDPVAAARELVRHLGAVADWSVVQPVEVDGVTIVEVYVTPWGATPAVRVIASLVDASGVFRRHATWRECASIVGTRLNLRSIGGPDGGLVRVDHQALQALALDLGAELTHDASVFRIPGVSEHDAWALVAQACLDRQNGGATDADLCWLWGRYAGDEDVEAARARLDQTRTAARMAPTGSV